MLYKELYIPLFDDKTTIIGEKVKENEIFQTNSPIIHAYTKDRLKKLITKNRWENLKKGYVARIRVQEEGINEKEEEGIYSINQGVCENIERWGDGE